MIRTFLVFVFVSTLTASHATDTLDIRRYAPDDVRRDLSYMISKIEEVHPNPYHSISKEALHAKLDSMLRTVRDSMNVYEAWSLFATLAGAVNEGHTAVVWPAEFRDKGKLFFPVFIKEYDGNGFVVRLDGSLQDQLQQGDKILSINGIASSTLAEKYKKFTGGLEGWKNIMVATQLRFFLAIDMHADNYDVTFERNGRSQTVRLTGETIQGMNQKVAEYRKLNASSLQSYSLRILDDGVVYINFRSMDNVGRFTSFADSAFAVIANNNVTGIIVDLRQNSGGNSVLGDKLFEYITDKRYRMAGGYKWKISQQYKDYYNSLPPERKYLGGNALEKKYLNGVNGTFLEETSDMVRPQKQKNRFDGPVYFLIGPATYSSANMVANAIKDFGLATLIGEPTGECPNDYGEILNMNLPRTGLEFYTSTKQYIRANGDANDPDPIMPDHFVKDDASTSQDETLEFAKSLIKSQKK